MRSLYQKSILIILIGLLWVNLSQGKTCSPAQAAAADAMVDKIDTWMGVDYTFKRWGHCDGGSITEGNSEAIARLLVDKWTTLSVLAKLIKKNPALQEFVLSHLNSTLDTNDLEKIQKLSLSACPKDLDLLCKGIEGQVQDQLN